VIVRDNGEYLIFIGNRSNGEPVRIELGSDIKNTNISAANLPPLPFSPSRWNTSLTFYKHQGNWYAFSVTTGNQNLYRYNFGNSLKNAPSAAVQVGTNIVGNTNNWNTAVIPSDC